MPDASNYISVSVRGPPGFALYENNERHKSRRGRCGQTGTDPLDCLQPGAAFHARPRISSYVSASSVLNHIQNDTGGIFKMSFCDVDITVKGCLFNMLIVTGFCFHFL